MELFQILAHLAWSDPNIKWEIDSFEDYDAAAIKHFESNFLLLYLLQST